MAKYMIVDGLRAEFTDEKNILQVIRNVGIHIPTFCYYTDLSIYGACRMCVVEDDKGNIIASCSTPPKDKMVIRTNTPKLHHHRKMILELLLASHCRDCTICEKNQKCQLQALARRFGLYDIRFKNNRPNYEIDDSCHCPGYEQMYPLRRLCPYVQRDPACGSHRLRPPRLQYDRIPGL